MKTPAQKVIYSLLTLILLLSIGSGVVATNGNRTELINPELDNELSEGNLKDYSNRRYIRLCSI